MIVDLWFSMVYDRHIMVIRGISILYLKEVLQKTNLYESGK